METATTNNSNNTAVQVAVAVDVNNIVADKTTTTATTTTKSTSSSIITRTSDEKKESSVVVDNVGDDDDGVSGKSIELDVDDYDKYSDSDHSKYVWLHAFYHSVVVCIGTGILGLAHSCAYLNYIGFVILMTFIAVCSYYTANLLIVCQTTTQGTYTEVAQDIMGIKFAYYIVRPFQFLQFFCLQPTLIVVGGKGMSIMDGLNGTMILSDKVWSIIMGIFILLLSMVSNLNNAWQISFFGFIAAIAIAVYSIVGSGIAIITTENEDINFGRPSHVGTSNIGFIMGVMSAIGSIVFAYGYHMIMPDIQASLHDHNSTDAHKDMKKATTSAYIFAYPAYIMSATVGYAAFGSDVNEEVLVSLNDILPKAAMYVIWCFVVIKIATEVSIFNQCAFTLIRDTIGLTIDTDHIDHRPRNKYIDYSIRVIWIIIGTLIAIYIPVFSDLSVISGAVAITPLSYIIPVILWNKKYKDTVPTWRLYSHYILMMTFILFAVMSMTGAVYDLIQIS